MIGEEYHSFRQERQPPPLHHFHIQHRVPRSLGIEVNTRFVPWKELKSTLLYCANWHDMNDWRLSAGQGAWMLENQLSVRRVELPTTDLRAGREFLISKQKTNSRATGKYVEAFMVFKACSATQFRNQKTTWPPTSSVHPWETQLC